MQVHASAPKSVLAVAVAHSSQGVVEKVDGGVLADHMPESFLIPIAPLNAITFIKASILLTVCATPITSLPFSAIGKAAAWMRVGALNRLACNARNSCGCNENACHSGNKFSAATKIC